MRYAHFLHDDEGRVSRRRDPHGASHPRFATQIAQFRRPTALGVRSADRRSGAAAGSLTAPLVYDLYTASYDTSGAHTVHR
jgi:hypothetical protein